MKNLLYLIGFFLCCYVACNHRAANLPERVEALGIFRALPDGLNNWRSAQPTTAQLDSLHDIAAITTIIRLNGNGKDSGGLSVKKEAAWAKGRGVAFYYVPIGSDPQKYAVQIHEALQKGGVLIHCRHGMHRTGAMVAYHLRRYGMSRKQVVDYNEWNGYTETMGEKYQVYYDMID